MNGKVILIHGRLCSGKSTYAGELKDKIGGVVLSVDEVMLSVFPDGAGISHDVYEGRVKNFLMNKSLELLSLGVNVILDWGFWTSAERKYIRRFYTDKGFETELHSIEILDEEWERRIVARNSDNSETSFSVDEGLLKKFLLVYEPCAEGEADVVVN